MKWLAIIIATVFASAACAADYEIGIAWPTTRTDSTALPLSEIDRFEMQDSGGQVLATIVPPATTTELLDYAIMPNDCFEGIVFDTLGLPSDPEPFCAKGKPNKATNWYIRKK